MRLRLLTEDETRELYGGEVVIVPAIENAGVTAYLKLTEGCSKPDPCAFCCFYRGRGFGRKSIEEFREHAGSVASVHREKGHTIRRIFLGEGDPLSARVDGRHIAPGGVQEWLLASIETARRAFPAAERPGESVYSYYLGLFMVTHIVPRVAPPDVASFVSTQDVLCREIADLREWREAGLTCVYWGMESGSQRILKVIGKEAKPPDLIRVGEKLRRAGIEFTPIVLIGLLGEEGYARHVVETVQALRAVVPSSVSFSELDLSRSAAPSTAAGSRPLSPRRMNEQRDAIQAGLTDLDVFYEDYSAD
jgi:radical SAM superfamily enzyme YgiQ (UPF0313 family)